jgi:hypothetical protein
VQQDVARLDVAVDDVVAVGVVQRVGRLPRDADRLVHAELALAVELVPERLALDERHHVVEEPVGLARIEEGQDVGVLQVGGGLDLREEALGADDGGELGLEDLEGDLALVLDVLGQVDAGHAALAELAPDLVAAGEGGLQAGGVGVAHVSSPLPRPSAAR